MRTDRVIHIVECHAEGEVGDVIIGGVTLPPADNLWAQSRFIAQDRKLKDFLLNEPRGGVFRHANLLVPPTHPDADLAAIIMEPETVPPMSGSNTMCIATVALETGILPMVEPLTAFNLQMPGGLIEVRASCKAGKVESVAFTNIPSFVDRTAVPLEVEGLGTLSADILFGGDSFVSVDAEPLGFALTVDEARELADTGMQIARAANEQIGFQHPLLTEMNEITFGLLTHPVHEQREGLLGRHCVAIQPGKIDRSPTGTAVSARLALLHERGDVQVGQPVQFESLLGSRFTGTIEQTERIGEHTAVRPSVRGRAWITGTRQLMLDPSDPWPTGYRLSDTWPGSA